MNGTTSVPALAGSNYLVDIAARIKTEHQAVEASFKRGIEHAIAAGELLLEAKLRPEIKHGDWLPWVEQCCGVTPRAAQMYMRVAKYRAELESKYETVSHLTLRKALSALAGPTLAIASLETDEAKLTAAEAIQNGADVRGAARAARKLDYNARIKAWEPKQLEGPYRIIYADVPWLYHQNQAAGIAEDHYDPLDDDELCNYRPGDGSRTVKELADENAVLFFWVTAPMLERCFPIIEAWGFKYKTFFVWDKVKHNVGNYNSPRAELLLICTRGFLHTGHRQAYRLCANHRAQQ